MRPEFAERHYLGMIWRAYNSGTIDGPKLEALTGHVVAGGHLDRHLRPIDAPEPGTALAAEVERDRRNGRAFRCSSGCPSIAPCHPACPHFVAP